MEELRSRLSALSYNDIRKEAKNHQISAKGKKFELIDKIVDAAFSKQSAVPVSESKSVTQDSQLSEQKLATSVTSESRLDSVNFEKDRGDAGEEDMDTLNTTFTVDESANNVENNEYLSDDNNIPILEDHSLLSEDLLRNVSVNMDVAEKLPLDDSFHDNVVQTKETKDIQHGDELQLKMQLPEVVYKNLPLMETENMTGDAVNSAVNGDGSKSPARECRKSARVVKPLVKPSMLPIRAGATPNRFQKIHQKQFDGMRSISDAQQKKLSLHEKRNQGISDRLKELAKPKATRTVDKENMTKFTTPADPATLSFKFGDIPVSDYAKVQRSYQTGSSNKNNSAEDRRSTRRSLRLSSGANSSTATPRMDVKQMTMSASRMRMKASTSGLRSVLKATTPVMTPRLERLATPKNARNISERSTSALSPKGYTPNRGRYEYVDTTKMNDREFALYMQSKGKKI